MIVIDPRGIGDVFVDVIVRLMGRWVIFLRKLFSFFKKFFSHIMIEDFSRCFLESDTSDHLQALPDRGY
jgi:hypothetical protein